MTADELVEKVARELCAINTTDPDDVLVHESGDKVAYWTFYIPDARAAIAIVVEDCATIADKHKSKVLINEWLWHEGQDWAAQRIGEAIRSLSPSSGSTGGDES